MRKFKLFWLTEIFLGERRAGVNRQRSRVFPESQRMEAYGGGASTNADQADSSDKQPAPQMRVRRKGQPAQSINGNVPNGQNGSSAPGKDGPTPDRLVTDADDLLNRLKNM